MRVIILLLFTLSSFAQNNNQKIAYQYFINGDYDKAIVIYEELNTSNLSVNIYSPYFISLINTNNFSTAEKLAKRLYSKNPQRLNYLVSVNSASITSSPALLDPSPELPADAPSSPEAAASAPACW